MSQIPFLKQGGKTLADLRQQMETHFLSPYCLTALGLPSSIYLDLLRCTQRLVEGITSGLMFMLWLVLGLLAAPNPSMCAKT